MLIRRELSGDEQAIHAVHVAAFSGPGNDGEVEAGIVDKLRGSPAWIPALSLLAVVDDEVAGHVCCSRARLQTDDAEYPVLGLGPLGVLPAHQGNGIGRGLVHAVLGAADALNESVVVLWGHPTYYPYFGFRPATEYAITPAKGTASEAFQARTLHAYRPEIRGTFHYPPAFD